MQQETKESHLRANRLSSNFDQVESEVDDLRAQRNAGVPHASLFSSSFCEISAYSLSCWEDTRQRRVRRLLISTDVRIHFYLIRAILVCVRASIVFTF